MALYSLQNPVFLSSSITSTGLPGNSGMILWIAVWKLETFFKGQQSVSLNIWLTLEYFFGGESVSIHQGHVPKKTQREDGREVSLVLLKFFKTCVSINELSSVPFQISFVSGLRVRLQRMEVRNNPKGLSAEE